MTFRHRRRRRARHDDPRHRRAAHARRPQPTRCTPTPWAFGDAEDVCNATRLPRPRRRMPRCVANVTASWRNQDRVQDPHHRRVALRLRRLHYYSGTVVPERQRREARRSCAGIRQATISRGSTSSRLNGHDRPARGRRRRAAAPRKPTSSRRSRTGQRPQVDAEASFAAVHFPPSIIVAEGADAGSSASDASRLILASTTAQFRH